MIVDFTGKVAVVTGAAGGIGYVCTQTLLESGARVALVDVNQAALDRAAEKLSALGTVQGFAADLSNVEAIAPAVTQVRSALGEIDVLIQCAGLMGGKPGLEITRADWDKVQDVNARGLFFMMQQVVAQSMRQRDCEFCLHGGDPGHASSNVLCILCCIQRRGCGHYHAGRGGVGLSGRAGELCGARRRGDSGHAGNGFPAGGGGANSHEKA